MYKAHLHALVDLYSPVVVVIQLLVDVAQGFQAEAVVLTYAWWHHYETGVCKRTYKRRLEMRGQTEVKQQPEEVHTNDHISSYYVL